MMARAFVTSRKPLCGLPTDRTCEDPSPPMLSNWRRYDTSRKRVADTLEDTRSVIERKRDERALVLTQIGKLYAGAPKSARGTPLSSTMRKGLLDICVCECRSFGKNPLLVAAFAPTDDMSAIWTRLTEFSLLASIFGTMTGSSASKTKIAFLTPT